MQFIKKRQDLVDNAITLEGYLTGKNAKEKAFALEILQNAHTMCVYKVGDKNHFAPNQFVGYKNNNMKSYLENEGKEGKDVNTVVEKVVGRPFANDTIENKFKDYLSTFGLEAPANVRKYWRIKNERGKNLTLGLDKD